MAISNFLNSGGTANSAGATLVHTIPVGGDVTAGATIIVWISDRGTSTPGGSITDSKSNSYTAISGSGFTGFTGYGRMWKAENVTALTNAGGDTITFTKPVSGSACAIAVGFATGVAVSPLDTAVTATSTGNSATPSVTAAGAASGTGELFIGGLATRGSAGAFTQDSANGAWATPFVQQASGTGNTDARANGGFLLPAGTPTQIYAPTIAASTGWAMVLIALKPAAANGGPLVHGGELTHSALLRGGRLAA